MNDIKKIITKCIVIATTLLIMVPSFIGIAYANETKVPNTTVEYIDVAEVEKDLKFLFTEATSYENGVLYVNKELLTERYGTLAPYIAMGIIQSLIWFKTCKPLYKIEILFHVCVMS